MSDILYTTENPKTLIPVHARPFSLDCVRLLDGEALRRQQRNRAYLHSMDPERLLHMFRVTAGLPSSAQPLGGWEGPEIGVRGQYMGHYLSACALLFAGTGDTEMRDRASYLVNEIERCQKAHGNGYVGAFPSEYLERQEKGVDAWAPYYVVHKILAGLVDQYNICGNRQALDIACALADHCIRRLSPFSPEAIHRMMETTKCHPLKEFGGMSEALHNLYAATENRAYLKLAHDVFDRPWFLESLARGEDVLTGLHSNTHVPMILGAVRRYELTGDPLYRRAVENFWRMAAEERSFAHGGTSGPHPGGASRSEHWYPARQLVHTLGGDICECCVCHNMLKVTGALFRWTGEAKYAEFHERAYVNSVLSMQHPDTGMFIYHLNLRPGSHKDFGKPMDTFTCCYGTCSEAFARLGDSIYYHEAGEPAKLWVNQFTASELNWKDKSLLIVQDTSFPETAATRLTFHPQAPTPLAVNLRIPYWAAVGATVAVNGTPLKQQVKPGSYVAVQNTWRDGDCIEISLPRSLHLHRMPDAADVAAVMYGPLVLAGLTGREMVYTESLESLEHWFRPVAGKPNTFTADAIHGPFTFIPLNRVVDESYGVYLRPPLPAERHVFLNAKV